MTTHERLEGYGAGFTPEVLGAVANVAEAQQHQSYKEFFAEYDVRESVDYLFDKDVALDVVDLIPTKDYDESHVRVMHLAMGQPLDPNQLYQIATCFAADPTTRLVAAGNPGGFGEWAGALPIGQGRKVYKGDLSPTVRPLLRYLHDQEGIETVEHVGYSRGADVAQVAAALSPEYDLDVTETKAIEPTAVKDRGSFRPFAMARLGIDFMSSGAALSGYVKASNTPAFREARNDSMGRPGFIRSLTRATNLATTSALANDRFEQRASDALIANPDMTSQVIWGTESELAINSLLHGIVGRMQATHGFDRVSGRPLEGQRHALANDIHLQAALTIS